MTTRQFDAPASSPRPAFSTQKCSRRSIVRIAWLLARFVRHKPVRYELYKDRFGTPVDAFRCDLAALHDAGIYRGTERLGSWSDVS
ncbi:MAG TPA: hypothetical protein VFE35_03820 [Candidatus Cybelea sp.]|jgi:hypothetical protein|nr:hypothetical protein [Candidatus Cybelea sp.]